jgi:hypothetical protein
MGRQGCILPFRACGCVGWPESRPILELGPGGPVCPSKKHTHSMRRPRLCPALPVGAGRWLCCNSVRACEIRPAASFLFFSFFALLPFCSLAIHPPPGTPYPKLRFHRQYPEQLWRALCVTLLVATPTCCAKFGQESMLLVANMSRHGAKVWPRNGPSTGFICSVGCALQISTSR